jgi:hypothetical protein
MVQIYLRMVYSDVQLPAAVGFCPARNSFPIKETKQNFLLPRFSHIVLERLTARNFISLGSVHAMKTEIPPFDSEIKDQLAPNDSYSHH